MPYEFFKIEKKDGVAKVIINRPPSNALSSELMEELKGVLRELEADSQVRTVVFQSAHPKYFMTGADLKTVPSGIDLSDIDPNLGPLEMTRKVIPKLKDHVIAILRDASEAINMMELLPKPTVAAINGHVLGAGLEFCLACDFRIMAKGTATIGLTEVNLGTLPGAGGTQRIRRLLGRGKAIELILLGRRLSAEEAESIGLIYKAVDPDRFEEESEKLAAELAQRATIAIAKAKECIYKGEDLELEEGLELEGRCVAELTQTEDMVEGISSFMLGKKPEFKGC